jgi:hypothetical protein
MKYVYSLICLAGFGCAVGLLMYANTNYLNLGDPKFGEGGWQIYWPLWSASYAPALLTGFVFIWTRHDSRGSVALHIKYLLLVLVVMEVSFVADIHWLVLVLEYLGLVTVFWVIRMRSLPKTPSAPKGDG